jgi:hypothetical protein
VNFFTPKLMKIRWSSLFFGSFVPHFQIKRAYMPQISSPDL